MKEKFMKWLNLNLKDNSPLLTKGQYDEIMKYLKAEEYKEELQVTVISR